MDTVYRSYVPRPPCGVVGVWYCVYIYIIKYINAYVYIYIYVNICIYIYMYIYV